VPPQRPRNQARSGPVRPRPVAFSNVRATTERPNPGRQPRPVRPAEPDPAATELPLEDHDPVPRSEDLGVLCRDHSSEQPPAVPACWPHRDRPVTALRLNRPAPLAAPAFAGCACSLRPDNEFQEHDGSAAGGLVFLAAVPVVTDGADQALPDGVDRTSGILGQADQLRAARHGALRKEVGDEAGRRTGEAGGKFLGRAGNGWCRWRRSRSGGRRPTRRQILG
jgi:hypothetical protein